MKFENFRSKALKQAYKQNRISFHKDYINKKPEIYERIESTLAYLNLPNYTFMYLYDFLPLKGKELLCGLFCKSPKKQNFDEDIQLEFISRYSGKTIEVLPKNNKILSNSFGDTKRVKSLDSKLLHNGKTLYLYQKYISCSGGAQDNQHIDALNFVELIINNLDKIAPNEQYILLIDGPYYSNNKKLLELKSQVSSKETKILIKTSDEFVEYIKNDK